MFPLLLSTRLKLALVLWIGLEMLAFLAIVDWIGVGGAVLAGIATSALGFSLLRRAGVSVMTKLRSGMKTGLNGRATTGPLLDETLTSIGALALLLPGFLSDAVGLALAVPGVRQAIGVRLGRRLALGKGMGRGRPGPRAGRVAPDPAAPHPPTAIDLDPQDWRRTEPGRPASPP